MAGRKPAVANPKDGTGAAAARDEIAALVEAGSVREAAARAMALLAEHPADAALLDAAFDAQMRAGDKQGALAIATRARETAPESAVAALDAPMRHLTAGRLDAAREACDAGLEAFPADLLLSLVKADLCQRTGRAAEIIDTLHPVLLAHPGEARVHHLMALAYHRQNEPEKALAHARIARELGAYTALNLTIIAAGLLKAGKADEAEARLREALALRPGDFEALALLSAALVRKDDAAGATRAAQQAIAARPFLRRGPAEAPHLCVVPELFRPDFFAQQEGGHVYNRANFTSYLTAPDFQFVHAPLVRETPAQLDKARLRPDIVLNNMVVGEAVTEPALRAYAAFTQPLRARGVPIVNGLEQVLATTREANSRRFTGETGFIFPLTRMVRAMGRDEAEWIGEVEAAFRYPILVRPPVTNAGKGVERIEGSDALRRIVADWALPYFYAIQYHECRGADGIGRMHRAVVIGSQQVVDRSIAHLIFMSHEHLRMTPRWAELGFDADERAVLADPESALGFDWRAVLAPVFEKTPLDIYGVDFSVTRDGTPIVFEINAAMNLFNPGLKQHSPYLGELYDRLNDVTVQYLRDRIAAG